MIAVYVKPWMMTIAQYHEVHKRLDASGAIPHGGRHHSCFGPDGHLRVFEIWDSQEDLKAFEEHLVSHSPRGRYPDEPDAGPIAGSEHEGVGPGPKYRFS